MRTIRKCTAAAAVLALLLVLLSTAASAATEGFEENNCLVFASEPGATSDYVHYYKNGEEQPIESMNWVDGGVHGKALSLDGATEYLQIGYYQLRMSQMTFSTWINFRGTVNEANPAGAYQQRLFTIHSGEDCYFTVSPHAVDAAVTNDAGQLDGVYMEYYRGTEEQNYAMKAFTGATAGMSSFGLPQDEWHHMAVVVDNVSVKLYIDGNLILEELFLMPIVQMSADVMLVGGGMWGDPLLNALVDDTMMFDTALSAEQIAALMQTGDVAKSLENPASVTTTATAYQPTLAATTVAPTQPTEVPEDKPYAPFGLPVWGFGVCVGLLALLIVLTVVVNLYEANWRKAVQAETPVQDTDEEHKRFLSEEEADDPPEQTRVIGRIKGTSPDDADEGGKSQ